MTQTQIQDPIESLVDALRDPIAEVEASPPTTRGHYAFYMGLFSRFADDAGQARVLARVLVSAGGNHQGVYDALKISYPH